MANKLYPKHQFTQWNLLTLSREDLLVLGFNDEIDDETFLKVAGKVRDEISLQFAQILDKVCDDLEIGNKFYLGLGKKQYMALCNKAWENEVGLNQYLSTAGVNFVVVDEKGKALHWTDDENDYIVWGEREEAEFEASKENGLRVITELEYLKSKGYEEKYLNA
jgi:hypothetical protein